MAPLRLRYSKPYAGLMLGVGVLLLLVSLLTEQILSIVAGGVITLLGVLLLINPVLVIVQGEAQQKNPLGMTMRRYPLGSPADLRVEDKGVWHVPTNKRIAAFFGMDRNDIAAIRAAFGGPQQDAAPEQAGPGYGVPPQQAGPGYGGPPQQAGPGYGGPPQQG